VSDNLIETLAVAAIAAVLAWVGFAHGWGTALSFLFG
jgi:hypothetical protein